MKSQVLRTPDGISKPQLLVFGAVVRQWSARLPRDCLNGRLLRETEALRIGQRLHRASLVEESACLGGTCGILAIGPSTRAWGGLNSSCIDVASSLTKTVVLAFTLKANVEKTDPPRERSRPHACPVHQPSPVELMYILSGMTGVVCLLCILAVEQSRPPGYTPLATFRSSPVANEMSSLSSTQGSHPGLWCDRLSSRLLSCYSRQLLTFASDF